MFTLQVGRYENKGAQPSADIFSKSANSPGVSSDFLTNDSTDEQAENILSDKELPQQFKEVEMLNSDDKNIIKNVIGTFIKFSKLNQIVAL